jgi:UDP-glucose 4-epimerase
MNVLVTGGCGYLGSRLLRDLPEKTGAERIRILDNMTSGDDRALMDLPDGGRYEFLEGDILDPSVLRLALRDIDTVVHLAAIAQTPFSFQEPKWVEQVNHWGTSHLVEACLSNDVDNFIYASSAAVYGPGGPHSEDDSCHPNGAYAHSKHQAEHVVESAGHRGLDYSILRLGMMYGTAPVTKFDAVANKFAKLAGVRKPLTVYGDGTQTRALLHVADGSDAICWALRNPESTDGRCLNVVEHNASINELVDTIGTIVTEVDVRHTEQDVRTHFSLEMSSDRLTERGWRPSKNIQEGVAELVGRFRHFEPRHLESSLQP